MSLAWYCIRTAPRQEGRVALRLRREEDLEVFAPRIRFPRSRMGRRFWTTEALFPGYLFARFDNLAHHRKIRALSGVSGILQFGPDPAEIDQEVIATLRHLIGDAEVLESSDTPEANTEVIMIDGPLRGLQLLVTRVMPARQRVAVLLEILGTEREVEVAADSTRPVRSRAASLVGSLRRT